MQVESNHYHQQQLNLRQERSLVNRTEYTRQPIAFNKTFYYAICPVRGSSLFLVSGPEIPAERRQLAGRLGTLQSAIHCC